jgi:hypothetical protein
MEFLPSSSDTVYNSGNLSKLRVNDIDWIIDMAAADAAA